jgi:peptide/nickel transport system substrate-binding protein
MNLMNMKQTIQLFIILFIFFGCNPSVTENNADSSEVIQAKGYYFEGDKKYKIYNGGIFRLNEVEDFKNLFPQSTIDGVSNRIGSQVYQGLLKLNQRTLKVENCLAESYQENEDGTILTFVLKDNVYFHDDPCFENGKGRNLTAFDVKSCFDMLCEPRTDNLLFDLFDGRVNGAREYYDAYLNNSQSPDGVAGVKVIDSLTVSIELEKPCSFFKKILTHNGCWIFPIEAYEKYGADMRNNCVGTGPFVVDKIKEGTQVRLVKNHNYWEKDENNNSLPYLDVVKITFTKDKKNRTC